FRYADVLFMTAAALGRQNGKAADAVIVGLINDVRRRAFADFSSSKMLQVSQLDDDRFLQEYAWEFCQEGHRRQQLIRFGVFTTKKWFQHEAIGEDDHVTVFPIPRDELLANEKLQQNDGYPRL
ncbi:MAG: RagB/SusD family nutrient uptake outer membrane protein, partial [Alistipes sp.]|uniref:RagB/SusD family nutrient uptake outer membrane protein n=1 Tax=Alistipes sp. TaxID=1872444 RepID=UPI0025BD9C2B